jgi:hypothetical protein
MIRREMACLQSGKPASGEGRVRGAIWPLAIDSP